MERPLTPVSLAVVGAGSRGALYAQYALAHPEELRIVGVAEPRAFHREQFARLHRLEPAQVAADWHEWLDRPRFADGMIIATPDALHADPAVALAGLGYHLLLEKPLAPTEAECRRIVAAVEDAGVLLAVGHVLRYTPYTQAVRAVLDSGALGEVMGVQHLEPVGHSRHAHSFVRGNWGNEARSSSMLLQKSCHDLDWLRYVIGRRCLRVSSFGRLSYFTAAHRPPGAADRCVDCAVRAACAFDAQRLYLSELAAGNTEWPVNVITTTPTPEGVMDALRTGPYGRCVFGGCDNDVVDHQVVNLDFEGGVSATFTMTAFTRGRDRETRIFGTRGELYGDGEHIEVFDFLTETTRTLTLDTPADGSILTGHGGGDAGLMRAFVAALTRGDPDPILSGAQVSLESHLMVFAAEQARRSGTVVSLASPAPGEPPTRATPRANPVSAARPAPGTTDSGPTGFSPQGRPS